MSKTLPRLDLNHIPKKDRALYCQRCMIEQPIRLLDPNEENSQVYINIECKKCGFLVARLVHRPPNGWEFDGQFSMERTRAAWNESQGGSTR